MMTVLNELLVYRVHLDVSIAWSIDSVRHSKGGKSGADVPAREELDETVPELSRGTYANALAWIPSDGEHTRAGRGDQRPRLQQIPRTPCGF